MQTKIKRVYLPKAKLFVNLFLTIILVFLAIKVALSSLRFMNQTGLTPQTLVKLIFNTGARLKNVGGRTNFLLLGIGGGGHEGADLTDTIMIVSVDPKQKKLALISIPRDIWSETLKDKVNSAYHYGEVKKPGGGLTLSRAIAEDVTGLPVNYALLLDFTGFKELIDLVGGVEIGVPGAFVDDKFPIGGKENDLCEGDPDLKCRYTELKFTAGMQYMDGARALDYVRSRHAQGEEGSDFARSNRQQEVLVALKEKIFMSLFRSPNKLPGLLSGFEKATQSDMNIGELLTFGKIVMRTPEKNIRKISLEPLLMSPPLWQYGRYVLVPKEGDDALHEFILKQLN